MQATVKGGTVSTDHKERCKIQLHILCIDGKTKIKFACYIFFKKIWYSGWKHSSYKSWKCEKTFWEADQCFFLPL